jgi:hypothetical protein
MSLFIARLRSYGGRAGERNMHGRLTVDRVLVVSYPVMAYSAGLERPLRQVNVAQIVHECTSILFVAIIFKSNPSRVYSSNLYLKSLILFFRSRAAATFTFNPDVMNPDPRCRVLRIVIYVLRQAARTWCTLAS